MSLAENQTLTTTSGTVPSPAPAATIRFFYGDGCSHCENVRPLLDQLQEKYPGIRIEMLEVYHNAENQQAFTAAAQQYHIGTAGVPLVTVGDRALLGDVIIRDQLETCIIAENERLAACNGTVAAKPSSMDPFPDTGQLTIPVVVLAALIDSINPCAFAILIFLLISLVAAGNTHRTLLVGGSYIAAIFIFHLLVGIGLFSAITLSGFSRLFSIAGAGVAIALGALTILDVFRNRDTFLLSVPESKKGLIGRYLEKLSVPAAFILGILAGLFGFSCTGGIYISILGLMSRSLTLSAGLPYLVLYNVIFVLPLVLVVLLVSYGLTPQHLDRWRTGNKRILRLVIGLAMVAIGFVILSGWIG